MVHFLETRASWEHWSSQPNSISLVRVIQNIHFNGCGLKITKYIPLSGIVAHTFSIYHRLFFGLQFEVFLWNLWKVLNHRWVRCSYIDFFLCQWDTFESPCQQAHLQTVCTSHQRFQDWKTSQEQGTFQDQQKQSKVFW